MNDTIPKKRISSSAKGKRGENQAVELLKKWWKDDRFVRNFIGSSGAVGTLLAENKNVPEEILVAMTSDIICPGTFPFSPEVKLYESIDLYEIIRNPNATVRQFWRQVDGDSRRINRIPLLIMRENRKQPYVVYRGSDLKENLLSGLPCSCLYFYDNGQYLSIATWAEFSSYWTKEKVLETLR